jgi:hypothetical protein
MLSFGKGAFRSSWMLSQLHSFDIFQYFSFKHIPELRLHCLVCCVLKENVFTCGRRVKPYRKLYRSSCTLCVKLKITNRICFPLCHCPCPARKCLRLYVSQFMKCQCLSFFVHRTVVKHGFCWWRGPYRSVGLSSEKKVSRSMDCGTSLGTFAIFWGCKCNDAVSLRYHRLSPWCSWPSLFWVVTRLSDAKIM